MLFKCLVCGTSTLDEEGGSEICPICRWEDETLYRKGWSPDTATGGPNGTLSLTEARENFEKYMIAKKYSKRKEFFIRSQSDEVKNIKRQLIEIFEKLETTESEDERKRLKSETIELEDQINALIYRDS